MAVWVQYGRDHVREAVKDHHIAGQSVDHVCAADESVELGHTAHNASIDNVQKQGPGSNGSDVLEWGG